MSPRIPQLLLALVMVPLVGCEQPPDTAPTPPSGAGLVPLAPVVEGPSLVLAASTTPGAVTVDIAFRKKPGREGPRVVELWLSHDAGLVLDSASPGEAATKAQKQVVAQAAEPGAVRVILFAAGNLERVGDGVLATVRFRRVGAGVSRVQLQDRRPIFAPADTDLGVVVGPAVTITGGR